MSQTLSFAELLKYVHGLDVKITEARGSWTQFMAVEHAWGRVHEVLNTNPEERYRQQVLNGMVRWYRLKLVKDERDPNTAWRGGRIRTTICVGVLADSDQEFLEMIAYHIAETGSYITIAQQEEKNRG